MLKNHRDCMLKVDNMTQKLILKRHRDSDDILNPKYYKLFKNSQKKNKKLEIERLTKNCIKLNFYEK